MPSSVMKSAPRPATAIFLTNSGSSPLLASGSVTASSQEDVSGGLSRGEWGGMALSLFQCRDFESFGFSNHAHRPTISDRILGQVSAGGTAFRQRRSSPG